MMNEDFRFMPTKRTKMNFEHLANELLLDIFDYVPSVELLRAFHGLNSRLNDLLYLYFQAHSLDCRSVFRRDFVDVCQNILPANTDQFTSIHLSNDDDTPDQVNLFLSFGLHFKRFSNLRSLSLSYLRSTGAIIAIISHCPTLISLHLRKCHFDDDPEKSERCVDIIWSLPRLQRCYFDKEFRSDLQNPWSTHVSSSLRTVSMENGSIPWRSLVSLFNCTSNLQNLTVNIGPITSNDESERLLLRIPSLTKLKIKFPSSFPTLKHLLESLPNLSELGIEVDGMWIDGRQWEELITNYLHRLATFRLLMFCRMASDNDIPAEINHVIESFETAFWLDERRWFVRCDYHTNDGIAYLYTLPFGFVQFARLACNMSVSTCPPQKRSASFSRVKNLTLNYELNRFASQTSMHFTHIDHLDLSYPFDDTLWSVILKFDRLRSLEVISIAHPDENYRSIHRLRLLLERAVHLRSLTIDCLILSELASTPIANQSIRRLNLMFSDGHFYGSECVSLIQSFLGNQCEVLLINIENRSIAFDLIDKLPHLRALTFLCQADPWDDGSEASPTEDELLQCLKQRLPASCSVLRDEYEPSAIQLWIR